MGEQNKEKRSVKLLNKGKKGVLRMIFGRFGIVLLLLLLQIVVLIGLFFKFRYLAYNYVALTGIFYFIMIIVLINSRHDDSSKITWLIIMLLMPIFGAFLYIFTTHDIGHRVLKRRVSEILEATHYSIKQDKNVIKEVESKCPELSDLSYYVNRTGCFPVFSNTDVEYFPLGDCMFERMLEELENAKEFIFLEYFIIDEGFMWGEILDILERKAKEGVDIRVMYDGTCEFALLPSKYPRLLKERGINCKVFAPITPFLSTHYNYRDHRKIMVIDGVTAFNGGINLADEYINKITRFGHWKDAGVMLKGDAVKSFTLMFLQMWHIDEKLSDLSPYIDKSSKLNLSMTENKGFVMPYGDCPLDSDNVGESVYMDILNRAHDYVYIMTPYLILDGEMAKTLMFAAQRSIDVRIIMPHKFDHFVAQTLAKTH
ncbi:MAG: phospholipase D-like domain-containing protein, partial [Lachnospiraceae bacterium]|nr:phospholipase D-like domain-containing protein [Lachnospiraceae bacterium]